MTQLPSSSPDGLHARLISAWRRSGMSLGQLLVLTAREYALGAVVGLAVGINNVSDETLVYMIERYVDRRCGRWTLKP